MSGTSASPSSTIPNGHTQPRNEASEVLWPSVPDPFFNMTLVSFQVENTLFRVPTYGFIGPGKIFEAMFSLPSCDNVEGLSNDNPIHLSGIKAEYFRAFLHILYPSKEVPSLMPVEFDELIGALELATLWEFTFIRKEIIELLSKLPHCIPSKTMLHRIYLGRKFSVADWIRAGYIHFLNKQPLTLEELSDGPFPLDWEATAKLFYIRDNQRPAVQASKLTGERSPSFAVDKYFVEELKEATNYTT